MAPRKFDWKLFLNQHRIEFVEHGPNVGTGEIGTRCPWCGSADPSHHLSISPVGRGYVCRRNRSHSGTDRVKLIQALLRCSFERARELAQLDRPRDLESDEDAISRARRIFYPEEPRKDTPLKFPSEFKSLDSDSRFKQPYLDYLYNRGYDDAAIDWLIDAYNLHFARKGPWARRIIIPVEDRREHLLTWTARSIQPDHQPRYKMLRVRGEPDDGFGPIGKIAASELILGLPLLWNCPNPEVLVIVEGPFDAFKINAYARHLGVYATCLFGINALPAQVGLLHELRRRFSHIFLVLDSTAKLHRLRMLHSLADVKPKLAPDIPDGVKDPGELDELQVISLAQDILIQAQKF